MSKLILFVIAVFAVIALSDLPALVRDRSHRELAVFLVFFALAFAYAAIRSLRSMLPSALGPVAHIITDILGLKYPEL